MRLSCMGTEIRGFKDVGVTTLTFWGHVRSSVTWPSDLAWALSYWWSMMTMRLSSTDTEIRSFKDWASNILALRVWPFGITWRYRSRAHWIRHMWCPIGSPLELSVYLAPLRRYWAPNIMGSRVWPFGNEIRDKMNHNLISLKDNYALFAPTLHLFWGPQMRLKK